MRARDISRADGPHGRRSVASRDGSARPAPRVAAADEPRRRLLRVAAGGIALGSLAALARRPVRAELGAGEIRLRDLYAKGRDFSALAESLDGERVAVRGYMAPPLKADSDFFVLTKRPMAVCPFCSDAADWPKDIVAVHVKRAFRAIAFNIPIVVTGRLELGTEKDETTGFVSRVRLVEAGYERV